MELTYTNRNRLAGAADFTNVVRIALVREASLIAVEELTESEEVHEKRYALAMSVLANPEGQTKLFALHIAAVTTATFSMEEGKLVMPDQIDAGMQNVIQGIWNIRAGVKPTELKQ